MNTLGREINRGQFAGLLAGATGGTVMLVRSSAEPMWHEDTIPLALFGALVGGFFGVLGGSVAGVTLRFMRRAPGALAATAAGLAVTVTVGVALFALGWASVSSPWRFPVVVGVLAGVTAAGATPWIRRSPTNASQ